MSVLLFSRGGRVGVLATEPSRGGVPAPHKSHEISLCSLLQRPEMAMMVATHVSLLLVVGLVIAPYQTQMLPLCSYFLWRAVAVAGPASLLAAFP